MPIVTDTPVVVPAQEAAEYANVWFPLIRVLAPDCNKDADVLASFRKYRTKADGTNEFAPSANGQAAEATLMVSGLAAKSDFASTDSLVQQAAVKAILDDPKTTLPILLALTQQVLFKALETYGKSIKAF